MLQPIIYHLNRLSPLLLVIFIFNNCQGQRIDKNPNIQVSSGSVERIANFQSKFVESRNVDVWLPTEYSNQKAYAVLYMHDGQMLFDSAHTWNQQEWGVDEVISSLLQNDQIRNTIVVGIWNNEFRHSEYFPQKAFEGLPEELQDRLISPNNRNQQTSLFKTQIKSDAYLKFIVQELKPFIDSHYSTLSNQSNTFISGSSMGALISLYAICEYPNVFGGAGCLSTHWVGTFETANNPIPNQFGVYLQEHLPDQEDHKIYFDLGTKTLDSLYEPYQRMVDSIMIEHNYTDQRWRTMKFEGESHSEKSWHKRLHIPLGFLLAK